MRDVTDGQERTPTTFGRSARRWGGALLFALWYFPGGLLAPVLVPRVDGESVFDAPIGLVMVCGWYAIWVGLLAAVLARSADSAMPTSGRRWGSSRRSVEGRVPLLLLAGAAALAFAQVLPAYLHRDWLSGDIVPVYGAAVTLSGWIDAMLDHQSLLLIGWTSNLWLLVGIALFMTGHPRASLALGVLAELLAIIGIVALANVESLELVVGLEVGAWVWLTGMTLVAFGLGAYGIAALRGAGQRQDDTAAPLGG